MPHPHSHGWPFVRILLFLFLAAVPPVHAGTDGIRIAMAGKSAPRQQTDMSDLSGWKFSQEAKLFYYYLLLSDGLSENRPDVIDIALKNLLRLDPALPVYQDGATILLERGEYGNAEDIIRQGLKRYPGDNLLILLLSSVYRESGRPGKAIALLERRLKSLSGQQDGDTFSSLYDELTRLYLEAGEEKKALDLLAHLPGAARNLDMDMFHIQVLASVGRHAEARELLQNLLKEQPDLPGAWTELGQILEREKNIPQALAAYEESVRHEPENPETRFRMMELFIKEGRTDKALESLEGARPDGSMYIQAALRFADAGLFKEAVALLDKAEKDGADPDAVALLSSLLMQENPDVASLDALNPLENINRNHPLYEAALRQKVRIYMRAENYEKARDTVFEARILTPGTKELWGLEAYILGKAGKIGEAEKLLREALESWPGDEDILFALATLQDQAGKKDAAMRAMEDILAQSPRNAQALNYVGYTLAEKNADLDRALVLINTALEQEPDADYIVDSLAWVHYRMGDYNAAWENIKRCLALGGDNATMWEHYGDIALKLGKLEEASKGYAEALARKPDNSDALREKLTGLEK